MVITETATRTADDTIRDDEPAHEVPRRSPFRKVVVTVAFAVTACIAVGVAVTQARGPDVSEPAARSRDDVVRELVDSGIVPAASLDDGSRIVGRALALQLRDDAVRELVASGLVPAATLSDGTGIVGSALGRRSSGSDDVVRELVASGAVPAATLSDGTEIVSPALQQHRWSRDDIVRDLVARGVVPAATLDDGSQIQGPRFDN
jgi:hypothetical protein